MSILDREIAKQLFVALKAAISHMQCDEFTNIDKYVHARDVALNTFNKFREEFEKDVNSEG